MALRTPDKADDKLNPGQADYDRKFNGLAKREEAGTFDDIAKNYDKSADPSQENANIANALNREKNPEGDWETKLKAARDIALAASGNKPTSSSKSPLVVILIIIFGGGFSFAGLFGAFSLLPINLVSDFLNKEDAQNTSFSIRADKIINTKIVKDVTKGYCGSKPLLCKYERPSNKLLRALDKEGIHAVDKAGNTIISKGLFPNSRPDHFTFKGHTIPASEFSNRLANDPAFRAAFHNAYTPRFIGFADKIYQAIKARFSITSTDKLKSSTTPEETQKALDENSKGPETGAGATAGGEEENFIKKEITATGTTEAKNVGKAGKGNLVGLIAGVTCALTDIPGLIIATVRAYQMLQLISYASTVLSTVGAWKAGDAQPAEITSLGALLTTTVAGSSAMDSFGIKNILFGDKGSKTDTIWKNYAPGSSVINTLGGVNQFTSSTVKTDICNVATNPVTGAVIDVATSETIIGPIINAVGGAIVGTAIDKLAEPVISGIIGALPPDIFQPLLSFFLGDLTKGLVGVQVGDALSSGIVHLLGQTANKGGNMALTVKQKLAYDNTTTQVNLAYAEEDRATHSPLDATNPNTFLGSLVGGLLPYYSDAGSLTGMVTSLGSIVTGSVGSLFKQASAGAVADDGSEYRLCEDPAISSKDIAAGPFCNIEYGIPPEWLGLDPEDVANDLVNSGDVDPTTGEPIDKSNQSVITLPDPSTLTDPAKNTSAATSSGLSGWMTLCTDGTTSHAADCQITDKTTAEYALYTIDHRVQTTMDGEDATLDPDINSATATPDTTTTTPAPAATDTTTPTTTDTTTTPAPATTDTTTTGSSLEVIVKDPPIGYNSTSIPKLSNLFAYALPPRKFAGTTI
ncbi:hypothetical protein EPN95_00365 [Patescibacteria group bacterium]|nr:MAG: hypothetical protein EPN95_00365 [Patescibacteria group bacterium]